MAAEPLRVLLVTEAAGGGVGRHILDLADGLMQEGHSVCLIYSPVRADADFERRAGRMRGLTLEHLPIARSPRPGDLLSAHRLRRTVRRLGPFDIIHGHSSKAGALIRLACRDLAPGIVYTPHALYTLNPDLGRISRIAYGTIERWLARCCPASKGAIICVSDDEYKHATELGLGVAALHTVANGIDPMEPADRSAARKRFGLETDHVCMGFVGRISPQKAVDRLLTEFASVASERPRLKLIIVGDGPARASAETLASDLGIDEQTLFTGKADGRQAMAAFDVFVLPSRYEGFPYVLLEAAASGLPIITTDVGGAATIVESSINGMIVRNSEAGSLGRALRELHDDASLRRSMGLESARRSRRFNKAAMVAETLAVYSDLLCSPRPAKRLAAVSTNSCR
jgi:glycosyltransferase involved in cell wall biosynthesis